MAIKLKDIIPAPWNTRGEIKPESVKELAQSIDAQGLICPITIWKDADGKWICIAGNRRLAAIRTLHGKDFDGNLPKNHYVVFAGTETEARALTITENLQREGVGIIEEADSVTELFSMAMTAKDIAATLGRSLGWVKRRFRISALSPTWRERAVAANIDASALEFISAYDGEVQERVARKVPADFASWHQMRYYFEREMNDLDAAKFDVGGCRKCVRRTGTQSDLFGECAGKLGSCLDCKCFDAKKTEAEEREIADATKGANEIVRVGGYWEMPSDKETSDKRSKKHPCAYVLVKHDGEVEVRWGESKKEKDERAKKEREQREAEREAQRAESEREDGICSALDDWKNGADDKDECAGLADVIDREVGAKVAAEIRGFVMSALVREIDSWHDSNGWAQVIRAFPQIAALAGVSDDDRDFLLGAYPDENED